MRTERTTWEGGVTNTLAVPTLSVEEQPAIGVEVLWNARWWQPTLVIRLGHLRVQLGWLVDDVEQAQGGDHD